MQLDRIAIALHRRNAWQAVDLGFAVARGWWPALWAAWTLPALLLFVPLALLLPDDLLWLSIMAPWWFKPLWDAVPLYIASRRLFGEPVALREAWRRAPRLLGRELLPWLTWRRLSATRSADLPVSLLERLRGPERQRRLRQLHAGMGSAAGWLTIVCMHFEMVLMFGALGLAALMLPEQADFDAVGFVTAPDTARAHIYNALAFVAMSVVAPAYTMGGFMLYICRRVELEGWDIEIRFRDLAARSGAATARATPTLGALLVAAALSTLVPARDAQAAAAVTPAAVTPDAEKVRIGEILDGPEFHQRVERRTLKPRQPVERKDDAPDWLVWLRDWLARWKDDARTPSRDGIELAQVVVFLLWLAAGAALLYVLRRLRSVLRGLSPQAAAAPAPAPEILFGLDVRPASLPADVAGQALALWQAGAARAALGLLYRATLARLIAAHRMPFADHHTEGECARLVHRLAPARAAFFDELTRAWQLLAYAHRAPDERTVTALCRQWREAFGDAA